MANHYTHTIEPARSSQTYSIERHGDHFILCHSCDSGPHYPETLVQIALPTHIAKAMARAILQSPD